MNQLIDPVELGTRAYFSEPNSAAWASSPYREVWYAFTPPMQMPKKFSEEAIAVCIKLGL